MLFRAAEYKGTHDVHHCGNPISHSAKLADTTRSLCHSDGDVFSENSGSKRRHDGNSHLFLRVRISGAKCVVGSNELFHTRATLAHFLAAQLSYALAWQRSLQKEPALNVCSGARTSRYQAPLAVASGIDCHCNYQRQACELSSPAMLFLTRPLLRSRRFPAAPASVALS